RRLSPRRRTGAFARAGQFVLASMGSGGGTLTTLGRRGGMWRRDVAAAVRLVKRQTKSPLRMAPRGLNNF
ncbi:hypothetical protein NQ246_26450, partial [Escherichia coli]|nr:hypothetical protein [Escherichia coli]